MPNTWLTLIFPLRFGTLRATPRRGGFFCHAVYLPAFFSIIISRTDREDSLKLAKFLRNHEEDEMPVVTPPTRLDLIEKQPGELYKKIHCHDSEEIRRASLYTSEK